MKHFTPVLASLAVLITFVLWCCTESAPHPALTTTAKKGNALDTCSVFAIDPTLAGQEQRLWWSKRTAINSVLGKTTSPADTNLIAKSFHIRKCDLLGMLKALSDTTAYRADSIWASLAIRNNQITLIFHDYDLRARKEVYYDFTRPCPPGVCE